MEQTTKDWQDDVIPAPCVRRFRIDIIRPTTEQLVDNLPSGNISRQNGCNKELDTKIKIVIAPKMEDK